jgi:integrase
MRGERVTKSVVKPKVPKYHYESECVAGQGRVFKRGKIWYVDFGVDGRRKRMSASGEKEEALKMLAAKRTDILRGALGFEKKQVLLFSDFAEEYKKIKAETLSIRSVEVRVKHLVRFFRDIPMSKITPQMVEEYKQKRLKQKVKVSKDAPVRTVKGSSVNRELATLKNIFNVALRQRRFRGENPVSSVSFFPEQARDYVLSREEVGRLLEAADERLKKIILIALNTGLRKGEILSLKWSQINYSDGVISFARTKSIKFLRVPMNSVVLGVLESIERKGDYVFPGRWEKGHISDSKKPFEIARAKAGLPELRFHDLRHCAGTYMAMAGVPLTTVGQILGHRDIKTTTRYINPNDENRRKAVNALAALFSNEGKPDISEPDLRNLSSVERGEREPAGMSHN